MNTFYNEHNTPEIVMSILEAANRTNEKLRIWYGDTTTGRDWMEVYDTFGYIGRSCGTKKIPLLIKRKNSSGGGAILTSNIVKITKDKRVIYQHPKYHLPTLTIVESNGEYPFSVYANDTCIRNCKTYTQAQNEIDYHKGLRNIP